MCSYCGCDAEPVMARLMEEHAVIARLVLDARRAAAGGNPATAVAVCAELVELFGRHAGSEERGLFAQMRGREEWADTLAGLDSDHATLRAGLAAAAAGDLSGLDATLSLLVCHADREDTDVFPAALQLLPDAAWAPLATGRAVS